MDADVKDRTKPLLLSIALCGCILMLFSPAPFAQDNEPKKVLVLHSYHRGLSWDDAIDEGIESVFKESGLNIEAQIEYMDTKRIHNPSYLRQLRSIYKTKFGKRKFDVIISTDNNALNFLLKHHDDLFPQTPVIFCGVNYYQDSMLAGRKLFSGAVEDVDIREILSTALRLHPKTRQVVVYGDSTPTYFANKEHLKRIIPDYAGRVDFRLVEDLNINEVQDHIRKLPDYSLILNISSIRDDHGIPMPFTRAAEKMASVSRVPIYGCWDFFLGHGIVGGKLTSGFAQGETAARMSLRVLQGEKVEDIPVLKKSPNRFMFDYNQMTRFGLDPSDLPRGSILINEPQSFYSQYKALSWSVAIIILSLLAFIIILGTAVSRRKQAEEALRESEEALKESESFLNTLINAIPTPVFYKDRDGKYLGFNSAFETFFGATREQLMGKSVFDINPPELAEIYQSQDNELLNSGGTQLYESQWKNAHGKLRDFIFSKAVFTDNKGTIAGLIGVLTDITDRKRAEKALKENEARLKKAQWVAKLGNWEYDISTGKTWGSEQAFGIYGIERTSPYLLLEQVEACIPDASRVNRALVDLIQENKKYDIEYEVDQEVTGNTILIRSIAELVYENGMPIKVSGVIQDVTEQKKAEEEQKNLETQLQHAQKMEAIGTLAGGVAHDLNNILGGIVSYPELLLLQIPGDSPLRESIFTIQKSGEKAAAIVQDLLTLARRGVVVSEVVNLNDVVSEYLKSPEQEMLQSHHPGVYVETHLEKNALNILGSSIHLSKTLMNLSSNAAEAMPEGGKLTVSTKNRYIDRPVRGYDHVKEGDYVVLTVSDTGTGISPDDIGKIFEPFYTKKKMGRSGTGLGMAVVWGTVKDHNGYIYVQSTEGKGTTFTLYFPVTRNKLTEDKFHSTIESYSGNGESILIVDDVEEQRNIASGMLEELGYSIVSVSSGEEAVEYLKSNKIDLLVLDMIMDPGMDGLETYRKIIEIHPGQKAIIASGFSETDRVKEVQSLGAGAYIRKPLLLKKVGLAVKEELEK